MKYTLASLLSIIEKKLSTKFQDATLCTQYANWLVQVITQKSEIALITQQEINWTDAHQAQLDDVLDKLINQNMPLAYVLGSIPFAGLDIVIKPPILIPRSETEEWVCNLIDQMHPASYEQLSILDLCTGSGCIALTFADAFPKSQIYGTDINNQALALAQENAKHNQLSNVTFLHSNLFDAIPKDVQFDLIVANPPYIPEQQWNTLEPSVKEWEDKNALIAPDQGMALIKQIIDQAPNYLKSNEILKKNNIPQLAIEIDATQGVALSTYLKNHGYTQVTIVKDLEGKDRVATGRVDHVASSAHT